MSCFIPASTGVCRAGYCKEYAMYSKPLASRMDGVREAPTKAKRGAPLNGAVDFSAFMPQGLVKSPSSSGMGAAMGQGLNQPAGGASQGATPMEQAATQNNLGLNQMRALAALTAANAAPNAGAAQQQNTMQTPGQNFGLPLDPRDLFRLLTKSAPDAETAETALRVKAHRKAENPREKAEQAITQKVGGALEELRQNTGGDMDMTIGKLAAQFESGSKGSSAIGYDRHGGTSYGKYQLSSRAGTVKKFIEYCKTEAPDIAGRLEKTGGSMNTGGTRGKMPTEWKNIAEEQPDRFEALQDKFIRASHFEPAMRAIAEKTGVELQEMPFALQEVVFSTAVQHGPNGATRIISRAMGQVGSSKLDPGANEPETLAKTHETLIRRIYDNRSGQFRSSTESVQAAVKSRLKQEMSLAINMLRQEQVTA